MPRSFLRAGIESSLSFYSKFKDASQPSKSHGWRTETICLLPSSLNKLEWPAVKCLW